MELSEEHIAELWHLYLTDQASDEQVQALLALLKDAGNDDRYHQLVQTILEELTSSNGVASARESANRSWEQLLHINPAIGEAVKNNTPDTVVRPLKRRSSWWMAAAVLLITGLGAYLWWTNTRNAPVLAAKDMLPGKEGAILTLSNGQRIVLDSLGNGKVASENGTVMLLNGSELKYDASAGSQQQVTYNTLSTPLGRQFRLVLPDGSRVWLNAGSAITYPARFTGAERRVEVSGEVYIEVVANAKMPFRVTVAGKEEVEVLGTSFNINAYPDEPMLATTLINGSVRVIPKERTAAVLTPGSQSLLGAAGFEIKRDVDLSHVMAWKEGLFSFKDADVTTVMRRLARWYNVEVVYEGAVPDNRFEGDIPMDVPASQVLRVLQKNNLHFRMEGNKIIVTP